MPRQEIVRDIPVADVASMRRRFEALGASVKEERQADGRVTIIATYPDKRTIAATAPSVGRAETRPLSKSVHALREPLARSTAFDELAGEYRHCYDTCVVSGERQIEVEDAAAQIRTLAPRYRPLGSELGIPWDFIAVIHKMESGANFQRHLHNGDPLTARTVKVPIGRPSTGSPPFSWEESARDALTYKHFVGLHDWSIEAMLYRLEQFNGLGYRRRGIFSPYLWSYSNLYTKGRYVADRQFDPESVSRQCGAAVLLRELRRGGAIATP